MEGTTIIKETNFSLDCDFVCNSLYLAFYNSTGFLGKFNNIVGTVK